MPKTLKEFFDIYPTLKIPTYQRPYSWKAMHFSNLLDDLETVKVEDLMESSPQITHPHFMGMIVLVEKKINNRTHYEIVDGQQRVSSIFITCAACRDIIAEQVREMTPQEELLIENLSRLKKAFEDIIYTTQNPGPNPVYEPKLTPNNQDKQIFDSLIINRQGFKEKLDGIKAFSGQKTLYYKAYKYVYENIKENLEADFNKRYEALLRFFYQIRDGLSFVDFCTDDDSDAFNLFETLNDRGLGLSAVDLIKNKILELNNSNIVIEMWDRLFGRDKIIESEQAQFFIRNFLMIIFGHLPNDKIYSTFKEYLQKFSGSDIVELVSDISEKAKIFSKLINLNQMGVFSTDPQLDNEAREILICLKKTNVKQWYCIGFVLCFHLLKNKITVNDFIKVLKKILRLVIMYQITEKRFNAIEKDFPKFAKEFLVQPKIDELIKKLNDSSITPHWSMVETALDAPITFEDSNNLALVLLRVLAFSRVPHGYNLDSEMSLEHVLPEAHEQNWGEISDVKKIKYSIGNMLLVTKNKNSQLNNQSFTDKRTIYMTNPQVSDFFDGTEPYHFSNIDSKENWIVNVPIRQEKLMVEIKKYLSEST